MLGFIRSSPAANKLAKAPHLQAAATLAITNEDTMLHSKATTPSTLRFPYKAVSWAMRDMAGEPRTRKSEVAMQLLENAW